MQILEQGLVAIIAYPGAVAFSLHMIMKNRYPKLKEGLVQVAHPHVDLDVSGSCWKMGRTFEYTIQNQLPKEEVLGTIMTREAQIQVG